MPKRPPTRWMEHCGEHVRREGRYSKEASRRVCGALWWHKMSPEAKLVATARHEGGRGCHTCGRTLDKYGVCGRCVKRAERRYRKQHEKPLAFSQKTRKTSRKRKHKRCPTCGHPHKYHARCRRS